jgi:hypothetical protein
VIWLCYCSILNFLIYEDNLIFFFISVKGKLGPHHSILSGAAVYSSTVAL